MSEIVVIPKLISATPTDPFVSRDKACIGTHGYRINPAPWGVLASSTEADIVNKPVAHSAYAVCTVLAVSRSTTLDGEAD
eukprot:XP_001706953.1 Hypothetical protein GL50803_39336 [Giardia lamblia ATCC 50803]